MRTYTWILVWGTLIAWSCHTGRTRVESRLEGYWELRGVSQVTIAGLTRVDYPAGNGHILRFNGSSFALYANGELKSRGYIAWSDWTLLKGKRVASPRTSSGGSPTGSSATPTRSSVRFAYKGIRSWSALPASASTTRGNGCTKEFGLGGREWGIRPTLVSGFHGQRPTLL